MTTISRTVIEATHRLSTVSASPRLDAELLLGHVLGRSRVQLLARGDEPVDREAAEQFASLEARRREGTPVAWLTGRREFWSLELEIDAGVLVPRPETESLVAMAASLSAGFTAPRILDLGTGSGAIAVALALECPTAAVTAVDRCPVALANAHRNVARFGDGRVTVCESDWYAGLGDRVFDVVVSNPPYIAADDPALASDGVCREPDSALVSADAGLADLFAIIDGGETHLSPGGWLVLEHGSGQRAAVRKHMQQSGLIDIRVADDLAGLPRVVAGQRTSLT